MVLTLVPMANSSGGGGGGLAILLPLVLIVGMIWFMSRSQRKQRQRQADTVAKLQPGARVVTTSGQVGVVDEVEDEYVVLEIAPDVFSRFVKQAVGRVLDDPTGDTAAPDETAADEPANDVQDTRPEPKDEPSAKPTLPPTHTES